MERVATEFIPTDKIGQLFIQLKVTTMPSFFMRREENVLFQTQVVDNIRGSYYAIAVISTMPWRGLGGYWLTVGHLWELALVKHRAQMTTGIIVELSKYFT